MKCLIVGSGGREHAIAWKLSKSKSIRQVFAWPGSPSLDLVSEKLPVAKDASYEEVLSQVKSQGINCIVVGPEKPLSEGFADLCSEAGIPVFGPQQKGAQLEASKSFAKEVMAKADIPTAAYHVASSRDECQKLAHDMLSQKGGTVIKASGLAGGKGVFVCVTATQIDDAIARLYSTMQEAAEEVVVEEVLVGRECSFFAFIGKDGATPLGFAVDFKRLKPHDEGPNTGGMGCYTPVNWLPEDAEQDVMNRVVNPLLKTLAADDISYTGCLYVGLMWGDQGPSVVEFNVRLGDPEAQVLAVQDQRDWGSMILQKIGLKDPEEMAPLSRDGRSVCVVLASAGYPYGDKPETPAPLERELFLNSQADLCAFGASVQADAQGNLQSGSGRVMTVVARQDSFRQAREAAFKQVDRITSSWGDVQFRSDIGQRAMKEEEQ